MNRNYAEANIEEKAMSMETLQNKRKEELTLENYIKNINASIELLARLVEILPNKNNEDIEDINEIENLKKSMESLLKTAEEELIFNLPYQKKVELNRDFDGDGLTNREEIMLGYDPYNYDSNNDGINDRDDYHMSENDKEKKKEKDEMKIVAKYENEDKEIAIER